MREAHPDSPAGVARRLAKHAPLPHADNLVLSLLSSSHPRPLVAAEAIKLATRLVSLR